MTFLIGMIAKTHYGWCCRYTIFIDPRMLQTKICRIRPFLFCRRKFTESVSSFNQTKVCPGEWVFNRGAWGAMFHKWSIPPSNEYAMFSLSINVNNGATYNLFLIFLLRFYREKNIRLVISSCKLNDVERIRWKRNTVSKLPGHWCLFLRVDQVKRRITRLHRVF